VKRAAAMLLAAGASPCAAAAQAPAHAIASDLFVSTDADHTDVVKAGLNLDWRDGGPEEYLGVRLEKALFKPVGTRWQSRTRAYLRAADSAGQWKWNLTAGSDGRTVLGAADIHDESAFRKEFFVEREVVETRTGLKRGIYYTFGGAAIDLPLNDRNVLTLVGGAQQFTGDNLRTHVRATYVHVLSPEQGLSIQLRTRYFHDSVPHEFDYYSPRWYVQAVPVLQLRRFTDSGWRYVVAGGVGAQRDSSTNWRRSSYFNAQVSSPPKAGWSGTAALLFSETPTTAGHSYDYVQMTVGLAHRF
jgi:hypothetical protein